MPVNPTNRRSQAGRVYGDVRDTFASVGEQSPRPRPRGGMVNSNVIVTYVAWSTAKQNGNDVGGHEDTPNNNRDNNNNEKGESLLAAAGSNGIVAIWNSRQLLFSEGNSGGSSTLADQQPEAILSQHTRAVNSLAWHPRLSGLLLTASQVCSV